MTNAAAWQDYLTELNRVLGSRFAGRVKQFWARLASELRFTVPVPHAGPTPDDDSFILTWDQGRYHFEVEIFRVGRFEWFYRDRETDDCEASEGNLKQAVSAAKMYLRRLSRTTTTMVVLLVIARVL